MVETTYREAFSDVRKLRSHGGQSSSLPLYSISPTTARSKNKSTSINTCVYHRNQRSRNPTPSILSLSTSRRSADIQDAARRLKRNNLIRRAKTPNATLDSIPSSTTSSSHPTMQNDHHPSHNNSKHRLHNLYRNKRYNNKEEEEDDDSWLEDDGFESMTKSILAISNSSTDYIPPVQRDISINVTRFLNPNYYSNRNSGNNSNDDHEHQNRLKVVCSSFYKMDDKLKIIAFLIMFCLSFIYFISSDLRDMTQLNNPYHDSFFGTSYKQHSDLQQQQPFYTPQQLMLRSNTRLSSSIGTQYYSINDILPSFSNLTTPYNPLIETPFLWDVPLTGASIVKQSLSECYDLTVASNMGLRQPKYKDDKLQVFTIPIQDAYDHHHPVKGIKKTDNDKHDHALDASFVNVDTYTYSGLQRAQKLNLIPSRLAQVVTSSATGRQNTRASISSQIYSDSETAISSSSTINNDSVSLNDISDILFTPSSPGRMFTIFRDPMERAVGWYHYIANATWDERYDARVSKLSLKEYAKLSLEHKIQKMQHNEINRLTDTDSIHSDKDDQWWGLEDNPVTRWLSLGSIPYTSYSSPLQQQQQQQNQPFTPNTMSINSDFYRELTNQDLEIAKMILKDKILVGIYSDLNGSLARFNRYFGWTENSQIILSQNENGSTNSTQQLSINQENKQSHNFHRNVKQCQANIIKNGDQTLLHGDKIQKGSEEWNLIAELNQFDIKLYEYAKLLYKGQGEKIFGVV